MKASTAVILVVFAIVGVVAFHYITKPPPPPPPDPITGAINNLLAVPGQVVSTVKDVLSGGLYLSIGF